MHFQAIQLVLLVQMPVLCKLILFPETYIEDTLSNTLFFHTLRFTDSQAQRYFQVQLQNGKKHLMLMYKVSI